MATVNWNSEALDSIVRHDAWRISHGWEQMATELIDAVEAYFNPIAPEHAPRFVPGRRVTLAGEQTELRVAAVQVRSKPFQIYFHYQQELRAVEILQVLHPRARYTGGKRQS